MVREADGSAGLVGGSEGTHALLDGARTPVPRTALETAVEELGADPDTAAEVVSDLCQDGLLI